MATKPQWEMSSLDAFIRRRKTKLGRDTGAKVTPIANGIANLLGFLENTWPLPPSVPQN